MERVGILGDGQLAQMLAQAGLKMGLQVSVLCGDTDSPGAKAGAKVVQGRTDNLEHLEKFFSLNDLVVFENEFLDAALLKKASQDSAAVIEPSIANIALFQDKLRQKEKLDELKIPTSPYRVLGAEADTVQWVREVFAEFGSAVFKWSRLGYDGKGVFISSSLERDLTPILNFIDAGKKKGAQIYAEKKIEFQRELALVSALSVTDEFVSYPLVISVQERGVCKLVKGPAVELGVSRALEEKAKEFARKLAMSCGLHGVFALEFFESSGELLVNEIAPRVHNSGHFSIDACKTSQFEAHWRAVLGMPPGPAEPSPFFAMLNLLGPDGIEPVIRKTLPKFSAPLKLHWYGKNEIRAGRKMGHINVTANTAEELGSLVNEILRVDREWTLSLKRV